MSKLQGVIETAVYADDIPRSVAFYRDVLGMRVMVSDPNRIAALAVNDKHVFLVLKRGGSTQPIPMHDGFLPPHDTHGASHYALAIDKADAPAWLERLKSHNIAIESRIHWPRGGESIYFRDPDGNLGELATPGLWEVY